MRQTSYNILLHFRYYYLHFFFVVAVGCSYFSTSNRASARLQKQHLFADALDEILYTRTMIVLTE